MRLGFPPPRNESDFENLCLDLLRQHWERPDLVLYGRRGEEQNGVDIFDTGGETPVWAAQCKLHEVGKNIPPREIRAEVDKAKTFHLPLARYAILTTGKVSTQAQRAVQKINAEHAEKGLFKVELLAWDHLQGLLDLYPEVARLWFGTPTNSDVSAINARLSDVQRDMATRQDLSTVRIAIETLSTTASDGGAESRLVQATGFMERYEFQVARALLNHIRQHDWDSLSQPQRYKVLVSLAGTSMAEGKFGDAGRRLLEATAYGAGEAKHAANESVAYELLGDRTRAFDVASLGRRSFPHSSSLLAIWVRNAPPDRRPEDLETEIPAHLADDVEVACAMALRSARSRDDARTESWSRRAIATAPDEPSANLLLGLSILNRSWLRDAKTIYGEVPPVRDRHRVEEARTFLSRAVAQSNERKNLGHHVDALLGRAIASEGLGEPNAAEDDYNTALSLMPDEVAVLSRYATFLHTVGRYERAIHLRRKAVRLGDRDSLFFLALSLTARNEPGDRAEATRLFLQAAADADAPQHGNALRAAIDCLIADRKYEEARDVLDSRSVGERNAAVLALLRAKLHIAEGDTDAAGRLAEEARERAGTDLTWEERRDLAHLLTRLGRHRAALPLWQAVLTPSDGDRDTGYLIECAARSGRHDVLLAATKAARLAGLNDPYIWRQEVAVLEEYDPDEAVRLLQDRVRSDSEDRGARLRLAHLGLILGRSDLQDLEAGALPPVEAVSPEDGYLVASILRRRGRADEAQRYAYELLRRHPGHPDSHRALHVAALPWILPGLTVVPPESVGVDTAVRYTEDGDAEQKWLVIENGPNANPLLHEYAPDHPLVRRLLGKKVGDQFLIASGWMQVRSARVQELQSKYLYRALESVGQWQVHFPDETGFETVRFPESASGTGDTRPDFSVFLRSVDRRHEAVKQAEQAYRSLPITLHMFARTCLNSTVFNAMDHLASSPGTVLDCCDGNARSLDEAAKLVADGRTLVLDASALQTLLMLEGESLLREWSPRLVVPQAAIREIAAYVEMCQFDERDGFVLAKVDSGYARVEIDPAERRMHRERYEQLLGLLYESCDVQHGRALAELDPERREKLIACAGRPGAEAILLSVRPSHALWTDDFRLALFAQTEFNVHRTWTQVVLQGLSAKGKLSIDELNRAAAKLLGWEYSGIRFGAPVLMQAGLLASWDVDRWPLRQALDLFSAQETNVAELLPIAASFLVLVHRHVECPVSRDIITIRLLDRLAARPVGALAVERLAVLIPQFFGLNVVREIEVMRVTRTWLAIRNSRMRGAGV